MLRKLIGPVIFGIGGFAILVALGMWQVRRLEWKETFLAEVNAEITATALPLPDNPTERADQYMPVTVTGHFAETGFRVLASRKQVGPGHRLIQRFESGERSILIDRGFLRDGRDAPPPPSGEVTITGNLLWPDETDGFTPAPDIAGGLWFARDVSAMASALGTEPILVVTREASYDPAPVEPFPVTTEGIPNDHREYAMTWFSLAAIWLAMTGYLFYRTLRPNKGEAT